MKRNVKIVVFLAIVFGLFFYPTSDIYARETIKIDITAKAGDVINLQDLEEFNLEDLNVINGVNGKNNEELVFYIPSERTLEFFGEGETYLNFIYYDHDTKQFEVYYTLNITVVPSAAEIKEPEPVSYKKIEKVKSKYTNFTEEQIINAPYDEDYENILGKFYETEFAKKNMNLLKAIATTTTEGKYGYTEDWVAEYLKEEIKTLDDVWAFFYYARYSYGEDYQGYMSSVFGGWNKQNSAKINIEDNCGVCCETAMIVNYLLEGDYEETGSVMVTSEFGHAYNYVKSNGNYYLIDFTDFTSTNSENKKNAAVTYRQWANSICFWEGKSLKSPSCTKAVLIHDTYRDENVRSELDLEWNYDHTGWIVAVKYENGMEGSIASLFCDYSFQNDWLKNGGLQTEAGNLIPTYFSCGLPQYTKYQTLWINDTDRYLGAKWVDIGTIKLSQVPWYCNITPKAQKKMKETQAEKIQRQFNGDNFFSLNNNEVKLGIVNIMQLSGIDTTSNQISYYEKLLGRKLKRVD